MEILIIYAFKKEIQSNTSIFNFFRCNSILGCVIKQKWIKYEKVSYEPQRERIRREKFILQVLSFPSFHFKNFTYPFQGKKNLSILGLRILKTTGFSQRIQTKNRACKICIRFWDNGKKLHNFKTDCFLETMGSSRRFQFHEPLKKKEIFKG